MTRKSGLREYLRPRMMSATSHLHDEGGVDAAITTCPAVAVNARTPSAVSSRPSLFEDDLAPHCAYCADDSQLRKVRHCRGCGHRVKLVKRGTCAACLRWAAGDHSVIDDPEPVRLLLTAIVERAKLDTKSARADRNARCCNNVTACAVAYTLAVRDVAAQHDGDPLAIYHFVADVATDRIREGAAA